MIHRTILLTSFAGLSLALVGTACPTDPECTGQAAGALPRCNGDVVERCTGGGYFVTEACAAGDTCELLPDGEAACFREEPCVSGGDEGTCSEDATAVGRCVELSGGRTGLAVDGYCEDTLCQPAGTEFDQPRARCAFAPGCG